MIRRLPSGSFFLRHFVVLGLYLLVTCIFIVYNHIFYSIIE